MGSNDGISNISERTLKFVDDELFGFSGDLQQTSNVLNGIADEHEGS